MLMPSIFRENLFDDWFDYRISETWTGPKESFMEDMRTG